MATPEQEQQRARKGVWTGHASTTTGRTENKDCAWSGSGNGHGKAIVGDGASSHPNAAEGARQVTNAFQTTSIISHQRQLRDNPWQYVEKPTTYTASEVFGSEVLIGRSSGDSYRYITNLTDGQITLLEQQQQHFVRNVLVESLGGFKPNEVNLAILLAWKRTLHAVYGIYDTSIPLNVATVMFLEGRVSFMQYMDMNDQAMKIQVHGKRHSAFAALPRGSGLGQTRHSRSQGTTVAVPPIIQEISLSLHPDQEVLETSDGVAIVGYTQHGLVDPKGLVYALFNEVLQLKIFADAAHTLGKLQQQQLAQLRRATKYIEANGIQLDRTTKADIARRVDKCYTKQGAQGLQGQSGLVHPNEIRSILDSQHSNDQKAWEIVNLLGTRATGGLGHGSIMRQRGQIVVPDGQDDASVAIISLYDPTTPRVERERTQEAVKAAEKHLQKRERRYGVIIAGLTAAIATVILGLAIQVPVLKPDITSNEEIMRHIGSFSLYAAAAIEILISIIISNQKNKTPPKSRK